MTLRSTIVAIVLLPALLGASPNGGSVEIQDGVLATVNGDAITLDDLGRELASLHMDLASPGDRVDRRDPAVVLDRLINIRLIVQEARNIGFDELPQMRKELDDFRDAALRTLLFTERVKDVQPAGEEVEAAFRQLVKEVRVSSALFETADAAAGFEKAVRAGADFNSLSGEMLSAGTAVNRRESEFLTLRDLVPEVGEILDGMKKGDVSAVIPIGQSFTVLRLEEVRFPEDPQARGQAEEAVLKRTRDDVSLAYRLELVEKYARTDEDLLEKLDFESEEPGFDVLREDTRTLATVKGEAPVTVADLAAALEAKHFHGVDRAIKGQRLNSKKLQVTELLVASRVVSKEARRLKLDETERYRQVTGNYENEMLFGIFVERVIKPDIEITEGELKDFMDEHIDEYTLPGMVQLEALVFSDSASGDGALAKLRDGADFEWMRDNAEGLLESDTGAEVLSFPEGLVMTSFLPAGVRDAVDGAARGDYRSYEPADGAYYVLFVREAVPSRAKDYASLRQEIAQEVFVEKTRSAVDDWAAKLREVSDIRLLVTDQQLSGLMDPETGDAAGGM